MRPRERGVCPIQRVTIIPSFHYLVERGKKTLIFFHPRLPSDFAFSSALWPISPVGLFSRTYFSVTDMQPVIATHSPAGREEHCKTRAYFFVLSPSPFPRQPLKEGARAVLAWSMLAGTSLGRAEVARRHNSAERSSWHGWEAAKPKVLSSYRHLNSGKSHFCLGFGEAV